LIAEVTGAKEVLKKARRGHGRGLFEESEMDSGMNIFEILQLFRENHSQR
jgi:hypothetical protein